MRAPDQYGNQPPDFVPFDADATESELDLFGALTWFHDFGPRATLQVSPFVRDETSTLSCDTARQLGATADPGQTCSDVTPPGAPRGRRDQPDDRARPA